MKKRYFPLVLALLIAALLFSACSAAESVPEVTPTPEPTPDPFESYIDKLVISELMVKNHSTLLNSDSRFSDWIELENRSGEALSLGGLRLSDDAGDEGWVFPDTSIAPGEFLLVFADSVKSGGEALYTDFSLSGSDCLVLSSPDGLVIDSADCRDTDEDVSLVRNDMGSFDECVWPSPGYENSSAGYDSFAAGRICSSPLVINEAAVFCGDDELDWVELKNVSDSPVDLSDYYLSDDDDDYRLWQLPAQRLEAGKTIVIYCAAEDANPMNPLHANFSLGADRDTLYLYSESAGLVDYASLHDIGVFGSLGRMEGENGFFYFEKQSPHNSNGSGMRRVSSAPIALSEYGVFEKASPVSVEIGGSGRIHYTVDGSYPTAASPVYDGSFKVDSTCVVRAVSIEDGALPSRPLTMSYIINEGHTLPVVSLAVDDIKYFNGIYEGGYKGLDCVANVSFFEEDGSFSHDCLLSMKGWTSLSMPKKSVGVSFKSVFGGPLEYDVFDNGISTYSSLSIRAGQDYNSAIVRNELFQELCLAVDDTKLLTQESKYCILYINAEYRGIYCLKEDFSKQYFASHMGVGKDSVEMFRTPSAMGSDFYNEVFIPCWLEDMSIPENYEKIAARVDIESLIDWIIFEGYSANTDTQGNLRVFRSPENGNKWTFALYDLDWGLYFPDLAYILLYQGLGNAGFEMPTVFRSLSKNEQFREQLLARFKELNSTVLSDEFVLAKLDELVAQVAPEAPRDRERWGLTMHSWEAHVDRVRNYIIEYDYDKWCIEQLCYVLDMPLAERAAYFGE